MVIANSNTHVAPYWGAEPSIVSGLNQLGIRNVAEQLFTVLLPGLNNVSIRIRYYSFYCWIIRQFYEGKQPIVDKEFNPFIRRAELLLALINATLDDRSGIPGINFAAAKVDSCAESFSLKEGADIEPGKATYWANHGGVLRQYYVASLVELGLIGQNEKYPSIYNITKTGGYVDGLTLANEFAESVGESGELFLKVLASGDATLDELKSMNSSFNMKYMSAGNSERMALQMMLLQSDNPLNTDSRSHRRETVGHILEYLAGHECRLTAVGFSRYMYGNFSDNDLTSWGWYAYYLDNNWQYQLTQIFHNILVELKNADFRMVAVDELSGMMAKRVADEFQADSSMTLKELLEKIDDTPRADSTAEAVRNLLGFYRTNLPRLSASEMHYQELGIASENFCDFMKTVSDSIEETFYEYVKRLIEDIIYRHYRISFRKMLQTQKATQKLAFENGCLRFIDGWDATDTSPRIDTMRNFLIDLNIIDPEDGVDRLTDIGINLLTHLKNEPATA